MLALKSAKSIKDFDLKDQKVFLRLDLNVPLEGRLILDDHRIVSALPTITYALEQGAKLVLGSHLGRPASVDDKVTLSLEPVAYRLNELLGVEVILVDDTRSDAPKALLYTIKNHQLILLENLRFDPDEVKNGAALPAAIASYIDIYINDAFGTCHRAHASVEALARKIPRRGYGLLMEKEVHYLEAIYQSAERPYVAILGGSKVSDKILVIEKLIDHVDCFIIGGAMAYTFLEAQKKSVGNSLVDKENLSFVKTFFRRVETRQKTLLLPVDHVVSKGVQEVQDTRVVDSEFIPEGMMGLDIGPKTLKMYTEAIQGAQTIFWNGPMGVFEVPQFSEGSLGLARALGASSATTIVGGGDSASVVRRAGVFDQLTHVSTGGGASLEFLQGRALPGIEALKPPKTSEGLAL